MKNIIILTSGLSGSSVVTHLLSLAGYWTGNTTFKKKAYDTFENQQLLDLNQQLLKEVNYDQEYMHVIKPEKLAEIEDLYKTMDLTPYKNFIQDCNHSAPWIWKDPRLWITFPFWIKLIDHNNIQFVFVDRKVSQRWISELLRKNIQTMNYCRAYAGQIEKLSKKHLNKYKLPCCDILYDDLIIKPKQTLEKINRCLNSSLGLDDLKKVYNKPLYQKPRGIKSLILAILIYIKNYHLRTT